MATKEFKESNNKTKKIKCIELITLLTMGYCIQFYSFVIYAIISDQLFVILIGLGIILSAPFLVINNLNRQICFTIPTLRGID